jgi:hypothetical protein
MKKTMTLTMFFHLLEEKLRGDAREVALDVFNLEGHEPTVS